MRLSPQMRGENPVDDVTVAQGLDGQSGYGGLAAKRDKCRQQRVIRPGFIPEQALQCVMHVVISQTIASHVHVRQNMSNHSLLILAWTAWKNGAQTRHKTQESRLSGAFARDGGRAG